MISDAKKIPLDIVAKQFLSCRKIFLLQEHFSYCKKKIFAKKKNIGARMKCSAKGKI